MKRFFKTVSVSGSDAGCEVLLDGRTVRTPAKAALVLPTEALAAAVAGEWSRQGERVRSDDMPLMKHACTAIDRVRPNRSRVVDELVRYAGSDLLCYRAGEPAALVTRQIEAWQPLLDWAAEALGARLRNTSGVMPVQQDAGCIARLRRAVERHDDFALTALHTATTLTGSLVLGLALSEGRIDAAEAWRLARIDEDFQSETWGADAEAAARAERALADLESAVRFLDLLRK